MSKEIFLNKIVILLLQKSEEIAKLCSEFEKLSLSENQDCRKMMNLIKDISKLTGEKDAYMNVLEMIESGNNDDEEKLSSFLKSLGKTKDEQIENNQAAINWVNKRMYKIEKKWGGKPND